MDNIEAAEAFLRLMTGETALPLLTKADRTRLVKLMGLLGSDHRRARCSCNGDREVAQGARAVLAANFRGRVMLGDFSSDFWKNPPPLLGSGNRGSPSARAT
jgi:hypothetical protein